MEDERLKIHRTADTKTTPRRHGSLPWKLVGGVLLVLIGIGIVLFSSNDEQPQPRAAENREAATLEQPNPEIVEPTVQEATFADDGQSLWVSPTAGEPIDLGYLLPGTQLVLHVRVAELLAHDEGEKMLAALGPWGQQVSQKLTSLTGVALPKIETLLLGIRPTRGGSLEYAVRFRLIRALATQEIEQAREVRDGYACFSPDSAGGKVLVLCPVDALLELVASAGQPPLFARELQRVLQRTDAARMATLVFAGKFLQISGQKVLRGPGEPLREALIDFLGDEATATAISAHWDDNFFLELQSTVALGTRPHRFAALLEKRVAASADQVEDVMLAEPPHPYGRKVLARFPAMLRKLSNYTRAGEEEGLCLLRAYLPARAGHNLVMGVELAVGVGDAAGRDAAGALGGGNAAATESLSLRQQLLQTTSLVFPKETLQSALEMLSEDIDVPIQIAGRDLQLEGITKNQSLGIDLREKPAAEILLAVLLRANPDKTASGPTDVKQKLVYVLREAQGDRHSVIVVTTRLAAARRGEKLPAVFEPAAR